MAAGEKELKDKIMNLVDEDNEKFLCRIRDRAERVGVESPKIEVRYDSLSVEGDFHVGSRAPPTLLNAIMNSLENVLRLVGISRSMKRNLRILKDVSGIVKPSWMTLLLGPPGSGKTTFLLALAGKLEKDLRVSGKVTYNGHELNDFFPQRTCGFVGQNDLHNGLMTPRETLDFSVRFLGPGSRNEMWEEISRREREEGIKPDHEIDAFMKSTTMMSDYVLKILGLEICADTIIGDTMIRGISAGDKKRVSIGEILVGPAKFLLIDDISTGLDSSTTFRICKCLSQMAHISDMTMVVSLIQPTPETFDLFDDIILLSEGQIVYQGPRENALEFFEHMGFKRPKRKQMAEFLQEVTSEKDQEQHWSNEGKPYKSVSVPEFVEAFKSFDIGQRLKTDLSSPCKKSETALAKEKYGRKNRELLKACFSRELLYLKRKSPFYANKIALVTVTGLVYLTLFFRTEMSFETVEDLRKFRGAINFGVISMMFTGMVEVVLTVLRLPVFYKQRDMFFYPAWAFALPIWVLRIPLMILESGLWVGLTYYSIGFSPGASRFFKQFVAFFGISQMALSLSLFIAAIGRVQTIANSLGFLIFALFVMFGGFLINKHDIKPWLSRSSYASPLMYGQNAIVVNEFLGDRWNFQRPGESTVGKEVLEFIGIPVEEKWFWVCIGVLFGFSLLFNILFIAALKYLNPLRDSKTFVADDKSREVQKKSTFIGVGAEAKGSSEPVNAKEMHVLKKITVLPIQPVSLVFNHVSYFVDMPIEMKSQGVKGDRVQLLRDISGAFRPGILTAIAGVRGAGKTTLMDVLAGRKTAGHIEGRITVSGYPRNQETFARVSGYCEQSDIHSPNITIYESLAYSAWLRLPKDIGLETINMFIEEVMELVELNPIREALVGLPGVSGLSTGQRKRLTIAVELVANPSIIFMDEPTSGLDAKAAATVIRTVRNAVDAGRTVGLELQLCTDDRVGLLSDITRIFRENSLSIKRAEISTKDRKANDSFYITDVAGNPVDPKIIDSIRRQIGPNALRVKRDSSLTKAEPSATMSFLFGNFFRARTSSSSSDHTLEIFI